LSLSLLQWPLTFLYPAIYIVYRQRLAQKQSEITAILNANLETRRLYEQTFGMKPELLFKKAFNWLLYVVPILINVAIVWALSIGILIRAHLLADQGTGLARFLSTSQGTLIIAAVSGAFVWGMYDALRRYSDTSLSPESLHFTWLRMLIAATIAPFVAFLFNDRAGTLVAFGIGAFPMTTLRDFLKAQVTAKIGVKSQSEPVEPPTLHRLQGATAATIEMLKEVGVDSVEHLAFADPLRLFMRTNIPWKVILDLIDQALLVVYIGDKSEHLRAIGIRGAVEFSTVRDNLEDAATHDVGISVVAMIAKTLDEGEEGVTNLLQTLDEDLQMQFIASLWGDTFETGDDLRPAEHM
jgi:hypothetical protein